MDNIEEVLLDDDILELEGIEAIRENQWGTYSFNDTSVPRVTHIISRCSNSDYLINWAANVGRSKYDYYRNKATEIGTFVHEMIEEYLHSKYVGNLKYSPDFTNLKMDQRESIYNAFNNFLYWEEKLNEKGAFINEIIGIEVPVSCPWYGGTIDCIMRINGAVYIIDFKTSKRISSDYLLQAAAYMYIINSGYMPALPHIDGIGIIRVDKTRPNKLNDLFINDFVPAQHNAIMNYQKCFASYVEAYYRSLSTEYIFDNYVAQYQPMTIFKENAKCQKPIQKESLEIA